jgi:hypothetical protein
VQELRAITSEGVVAVGRRVSVFSAMVERLGEMKRRTYTAYSIGCAIVWAVIPAVVSATADPATRHTFVLVFG